MSARHPLTAAVAPPVMQNAGMAESSPSPPGWHASLDLEFTARAGRTVLSRRCHEGPLAVQKALYPETPAICHVAILHPPGGIAGGDKLAIHIDVQAGAHAVLTTPGATKWYRSAAGEAAQTVSLRCAADARMEWLPQENIVFDAAEAHSGLRVELEPGAVFLGVDIFCLGRLASGEAFRTGSLRLEQRILRQGRPLWLERGHLAPQRACHDVAPQRAALDAAPLLGGQPVFATMVLAGCAVPDAILDACRTIAPGEGASGGVTRLPDLLVARWTGRHTEAARHWALALRALLRPLFCDAAARVPRLWNT